MRTRRSPRNQERLWKELGGKVEKPQPITVTRTDAEIDAMFWLSKTSRNLLKRDNRKQRDARAQYIKHLESAANDEYRDLTSKGAQTNVEK